MADPNTGPDSLRWKVSGLDLGRQRAVGTVTGVVVTFVGQKNPPGVGEIESGFDASGVIVRYRAPGSNTLGAPVQLPGDGTFRLDDGEDTDNFIIIQAVGAFLPQSEQSSKILITDRYDFWTVGEDYKPGGTNPLTAVASLLNQHATDTLTGVAAWIEPTTPQWLEISADGSSWSAPTTEATALPLADILPGALGSLHWRRTIADFAANPKVTPILRAKFTVGGTTHYTAVYASYRVWVDGAYRFYRSQTGPPSPTDTPFETSPTLPYTTTATFADGIWYVSCERFSGVLASGFLPLGDGGETWIRLDIIGGAVSLGPPVGANDAALIQGPGGIPRLNAFCMLPQIDARPTLWGIATSIGATPPPADSPQYTVPMPDSGLAMLEWTNPAAVADGETFNIVVQTIRNDGPVFAPIWRYSENPWRASLVVDLTPPAAPTKMELWPRPLGEGGLWVSR